MASLQKSFVKGFIWSFGGQISYLMVALIANVFLARYLTPFEFGQISIVMFFVTICKVLTESGLTGALVRKKDISDTDYSTVFIFNLGISILLFLLMFFISSFVADYYNNQILKNLLRALSFILLINAFQFTQNAKIVRNLQFKKQSLYALLSIVLSSFVGISLAYLNYGVWALVTMQIANALILTLIYCVCEGPVKSLSFSIESFKSLYKFGVNTTIASMINTVFDNIYNLILGKYFSIQQTGLFYQAKKLQDIPIGVVKSSTLGVVFSTLSKLQEDKNEFKKFYEKIVALFTTLVGLICLLIYYYGEQAVLLLYGNHWTGAVFYIKILIIASFFYMQEMLNRVLFKVFDRTDKILHLELIKNFIQIGFIIIGVIKLNLDILMYGLLIGSIISYFINYYVSRKIYGGFSFQEIILVLKVIAIALITFGLLNFLNSYLINLQGYWLFCLLPLLLAIYIFLAWQFRIVNVVNEIKLVLKYTLK